VPKFGFNRDRSSLLTFESPVSAVQKLNENTQRMLVETRTVITKPLDNLKEFKILPLGNRSDGQFQLIPSWLKPQPQQPAQPATITDWLAQPRPE
jgi:hypothetical protein